MKNKTPCDARTDIVLGDGETVQFDCASQYGVRHVGPHYHQTRDTKGRTVRITWR